MFRHCYTTNNTNTLDPYYFQSSLFNSALEKWNATHKGIFASTLTNNIGFLKVPPSDPIFKIWKDPATGPTSGHYECV
jgi:hypothetical protein